MYLRLHLPHSATPLAKHGRRASSATSSSGANSSSGGSVRNECGRTRPSQRVRGSVRVACPRPSCWDGAASWLSVLPGPSVLLGMSAPLGNVAHRRGRARRRLPKRLRPRCARWCARYAQCRSLRGATCQRHEQRQPSRWTRRRMAPVSGYFRAAATAAAAPASAARAAATGEPAGGDRQCDRQRVDGSDGGDRQRRT